ncbi:hypothetical protein GCM10010435_71650 [Winogradskya consettensis]|uniref:PT repeat-containing protein n=1 Tax=Winogradskya consettensis TaxID=113560 RepID=A0A919SV90_9ACTN|nr:hypothetical protein [Actinoplanes consettensis]GIM77678.1 hypothetical protein Aco04nite_56580 [Actinoplanes consettensis]
MPLNSRMTPRRLAGLFVASAALLVTAACGGGSDSSSTDASGGGNGNGANGFAAYQSCLSQNGVTITMPSGMARNGGASRGAFPSGGPQGGGFPSGMPRPSGSAGAGGQRGGGFPGGGGGFQKPEGVDDATWAKAQTACASVRPSGRAGGGNGNGQGRGNGMTAAYRTCLTDHGVTLGEGTPLNTTDATTKKAVEACKALAPTPSASPTP